jgi:membrane protease YdiL (CAAX protease family)
MRDRRIRLIHSIPPIWIYLILVFALSWPILIYGFGWFSSSEDILKRYLLSCTGMLMVAFSAFLTRAFVDRKGFGDVGWNMGHYKWYLAALIFCISLWLVPPLAALLFGKLEWNQGISREELTVVILSLGGFSLLAGLGEEFGWRGYLLPRLLHDRKITRLTLLIVGIIWGIWHCAVAIGPFLNSGLNGESGWLSHIGPMLVRCFQVIAASIALSFIFGAVWLKSKSIFLISFFHGYWIGIRDSVTILATYPAAFRLITLAIVLIAWFVANQWLRKFEGKN